MSNPTEKEERESLTDGIITSKVGSDELFSGFCDGGLSAAGFDVALQ